MKEWRRSYATPPPPVRRGDAHDPAGDPRYRDVPADAAPLTECLADVVARVRPLLGRRHRARPPGRGARGGAVLVVAHGNSLRALRKHIEGIGDDDIVGLEIPTGIPYRYVFDDQLGVVSHGFLGDPEPPPRPPPRPCAARPADPRRAAPRTRRMAGPGRPANRAVRPSEGGSDGHYCRGRGLPPTGPCGPAA